MEKHNRFVWDWDNDVEVTDPDDSRDLTKAKESAIGTKSTHGGKKVVKTAQGWVPDTQGGKGKVEDPEDVRGSAQGYGTHNIGVGDQLSFKSSDGETITGRVGATSGTSATVIAKDGKQYSVPWGSVTDFKGSGGVKSEVDPGADLGDLPIAPEDFVANEWAKQFDDPDVSVDSILSDVEKTNPDIRKAVTDAEERLRGIEETISRHRESGEGASAVYSPERMKKHQEIIDHFLSPEKIKGAKPPKGQKPTLVMLGGRGGSGKSWFNGQVYNEDSSIVLDADEIKGMLDEYEGWNAFQVHEESSDILESIKGIAMGAGLNVVIDATLKTPKSAIENVDAFESAGYDLEVHYMHAPRKIAAQRAMSRFTGKSGRYVPIGVILGNTKNEESFELIKSRARAWSFRDSTGGPPPKLVSELGKGRFTKAMRQLHSLLKSEGSSSKDKDSSYDFYDFRKPTDPKDYSDFVKKNLARINGESGDDNPDPNGPKGGKPMEKARAGTKYIRKFWKNGRWNYVYPEARTGVTRKASIPDHRVLKNLGGTTGGALLIELPNGERKVMKQSTGPGHLRDEYMANRIYDILGVPVPGVQLLDGPKGIAQVADFVNGTPLGDLPWDEREQARESLRQGFVADALLGNWDVLGMDEDNVLWDGSKAWRIDNGGSLRYRAQGAPKGSAFSGTVTELSTMRDPNKGAGKRAYSKVTDDQVASQIRTVLSRRDTILEAIDDPQLRKVMSDRIDNLATFGMRKSIIMKPSNLQKRLRGR